MQSMTLLSDNQDAPGSRFRALWDQSILHFESRLGENPDDVSSLVGLADSCITLWCFGFLSREASLPRAETAVNRVLSLDGNNTEAHILLGILTLGDRHWESAEKEFQHAITLSANNPKTHHWYALFLAAMGRQEKALSESRLALDLDPSPSYKTGLGAILYFAHDFISMADLMEQVIAQDPAFPPAYDWLGMAYVQLERYEQAIRVYQEAVRLAAGAAEVMAGLGHAYAVAGRESEARSVLHDLYALSEKWYVPPVQIAFVHFGLGDNDRGFRLLDTAFMERSWELVFLREEPWLDHLHSDPRFLELQKRMDFPDKNIWGRTME